MQPTAIQPAIRGKDESIETLRGLAILLVVVGHVVSPSYPDWGMPVDEGGPLHFVKYLFQYFRMPLFTLISGYVYALRPVEPGTVLPFLRGKTRRLFFPLASLTLIIFAIRHLRDYGLQVDGAGMIIQYAFYGNGHLWYLRVMIVLFTLIAIVDAAGWMNTFRQWLGWVAAAVLLSLWLDTSRTRELIGYRTADFLSIHYIPYLLPFFVFGVGMRRFEWILLGRRAITIALIACAPGLIIQMLNWCVWYDQFGWAKLRPLGIWLGLATGVLAFGLRRPIAPLAWVGAQAYSIYLFHFPLIELMHDVSNPTLRPLLGARGNVLVATVLAIAIPLGIDWLIRRNRWSAWLILGMRLKPAVQCEPEQHSESPAGAVAVPVEAELSRGN